MILIASATSLGWRIDQSTSGSPTWRLLLSERTDDRARVSRLDSDLDRRSQFDTAGKSTEIKKSAAEAPRVRAL